MSWIAVASRPRCRIVCITFSTCSVLPRQGGGGGGEVSIHEVHMKNPKSVLSLTLHSRTFKDRSPYTLNPKPLTLCPKPYALNP